ncbi:MULTISPECIES: MDR family MFS transporter [Bacillus]|uniref:MDR family MFS transporter n=1 Tax=Bacillus TaxID=1386 RepID=UPI000873110F|nr:MULTISPECIES: MFS transporter [Bacillus cereus group]OFC95166.1 major facilitator family transporter [Bacillus thuringiensis]MBJ8050052.1 MFS transporter [Bacillus cereus group sp. N18]OFD03019.1 major facilitator family transporter [Bacillus thuringiensis]PDY52262.1 MFS transporter [Bacillus toyonensis]PDZ83848.1 MFS transporter [Bacillus toyonensis]
MKNTWRELREMDRNVWIRFIGETLNGIAMMMLMPFFALYLKDKVDSLLQVGVIMALSPIAASFGSLIGGRIADIYGRKPIMIFSMASNALLMLGFLFIEGFISYAILSVFLGLSNSLFHPAASAMVADVTAPEKRTEAYGLLRMGHNIGAAIGPIMGASVVMLSKNLVFIIASSTMLFYALLVLILIQETMPKAADKKEENAEKESGAVWKVLMRDKALMIYLLAGIIISMGFSQTEGMLPLHFDNEMKDIFGVNNPYPYLMALNGLLVVLFQFQISKWATDKPVGKTMLYGACLFGVGLFFIGWLPKWFGEFNTNATIILVTLMFVYAIYTLGEMIMSPVQMTFVANLAPEHLRGTYMGAASLQWITGSAFGPLLGGFLLDRLLGHFLFTILGVGCLVAGIVYVSLDRLVEQRQKDTLTKQSS